MDEAEPYYAKVFSILAPKHHQGSLVYPGLIWLHYFGPKAISAATGKTLGDRLERMVASWSWLLTFLNQIQITLEGIPPDELGGPVLMLYTI